MTNVQKKIRLAKESYKKNLLSQAIFYLSQVIEDDSSNEELNPVTEPEPAPVEAPVAKRPGRPKSDPAKKPAAKTKKAAARKQ